MKGQCRYCQEWVPWEAGDPFHSFTGRGPFYTPTLLVFTVNRGAAVACPCHLHHATGHPLPPNLENAKGLSLGEEQR